MKKMQRIITLALLAVTLLACHATKPETATPAGETTAYSLRDFTAINVSGIVNVLFTEGSSWNVEVDESPNSELKTIVEIKGTTLMVYTKTKNNRSSHYDGTPTVRITAPQLNSIQLSGTTSFSADQLHGKKLSLRLSGASAMGVGQFNYDGAEINCSGACKLTGAMTADDLQMTCSGVCKVALNVKGKTMKAVNNGASECDLTFVGGIIDFSNSGAGMVDLKLVDCQEVTARNSGASKFVISGNADKTTIKASGVAKIDTSRLNQY